MALTKGVDTYCTVAEADEYHASFGNDAWVDLDPPVKEVCLRKATQFVDGAYGANWKGDRVSGSQTLDWPRIGADAHGFVIPSDTIPLPITQACAILALKVNSEELAPDLDRGVLKETIGPITTEYDPNSPQARRFVQVTRLLAPYLLARGYCVPLRRS